MDCLDEQTLLSYARGRLDAAAASVVDAHIDACQNCADLAAVAIGECGRDSEFDTRAGGAHFGRCKPDDGRELVPNVIGRYLTIGCLGSGGMGTVYSAYDPDLRRNVALKVLKPEYAERGGLLRREARALAKLAHPNVVQAFGVGLVEGPEATAFLVMELVDGVDLRRWRKDAPRTVAEIIDAYVQAGQGLAAAHAMGLVHCDFKPENALIGRDGVVRVSDFGLARVAAQAATFENDGSAINISSQPDTTVMGTPAYMAPEQRMGQAPDAKADQYAFCVSLWEALSGSRPPFGASRRQSAAISPAVRRVLRRGLAMCCSDRWPSMPALLAALRRPPSRVWRPVLGVVAAAALAGAVAVGWTAAQPDECARASKTRADAWNAQQRETLERSGVSSDNLDALRHWSVRWDDEHAAVCSARSAQRSRGVARCLETAAQSLSDLTALLPKSEPFDGIERALLFPGRCRSARPGEERLSRESVRHLSAIRLELARARALAIEGRHDDAQSSIDAIWVDAQELGHPPLLADVQLVRGDVARSAGDFELARTASQEAYLLGTGHGLTWVSATAATTMFFLVGAIDEDSQGAVPWMRRAQMAIGQLPPDMREAPEARLATVKGHWHKDADRMDEARVEFARAVALTERARGPDDESLAFVLADLGTALTSSDPDAALVQLERALEISIAAHGTDDARVTHVLSLLGSHHVRAGHTEQALDIQRRVLANVEARYGPDHDDVATASYNIGNLLDDLDHDDESAEAYERARRIWTKTLGPDHVLVGKTYDNLAALAYEGGDFDRAESFYNKALLVFDRAAGAQSVRHVVPLSGLAEVSIATGRGAPAVDYATRALALAHGFTAEDRASVRFRAARALWLSGRRDEATDEAERALQEALTDDDPLIDGVADSREIEAWLSDPTQRI